MNIQLTPEEPMCVQFEDCKLKGSCLRYIFDEYPQHMFSWFSITDDDICTGFITEEDIETINKGFE